jgi:hypothetical protein
MMANCFKCNQRIESAAAPDDRWETPGYASLFRGGFSYGSTLYDAVADGVHVEIIVCDDCLREAKGTTRMREVK